MLKIMQKYAVSALMQATSRLDSRLALVLGQYLLRLVRVTILISLWRYFYHGQTAMTLPALLTYSFMAEVLHPILLYRTRLHEELWSGEIVSRFLRPLNVLAQLVAHTCGNWLTDLVFFSLPLLLLSPLFGVNVLPGSLFILGCFTVSLALSVAVGLALELLYACVMIRWRINLYQLERVRLALSLVLSGAVIPLSFYPWNLGKILELLPFAAQAYAPLRIFCGIDNPLRLIFLQIIWLAILAPLAFFYWRKSREKITLSGG